MDPDTSIHIVVSKSRVVPVRAQTILRLELCGEEIQSRLLVSVSSDLNIPLSSAFAWTNTSIVLGWLNESVNSLTPFVANRVPRLQTGCQLNSGDHIHNNPAHHLSRGVEPSTLLSLLWWEPLDSSSYLRPGLGDQI